MLIFKIQEYFKLYRHVRDLSAPWPSHGTQERTGWLLHMAVLPQHRGYRVRELDLMVEAVSERGKKTRGCRPAPFLRERGDRNCLQRENDGERRQGPSQRLSLRQK